MVVELADADGRTASTFVARLLENHVGQSAVIESAQAPAETEKHGYVYFIKSSGYYKIGRASNVEQRLAGFSLPEKPEIVAVAYCADYGRLEMALHVLLSNKRANGEWFSLNEVDAMAVKRLLESRCEKKQPSLRVVGN